VKQGCLAVGQSSPNTPWVLRRCLVDCIVCLHSARVRGMISTRHAMAGWRGIVVSNVVSMHGLLGDSVPSSYRASELVAMPVTVAVPEGVPMSVLQLATLNVGLGARSLDQKEIAYFEPAYGQGAEDVAVLFRDKEMVRAYPAAHEQLKVRAGCIVRVSRAGCPRAGLVGLVMLGAFNMGSVCMRRVAETQSGACSC
jgi:hypothetical protein